MNKKDTRILLGNQIRLFILVCLYIRNVFRNETILNGTKYKML